MINLHTLDEQPYQALRYNFLVDVEESGDPKELPYLDSVNTGKLMR